MLQTINHITAASLNPMVTPIECTTKLLTTNISMQSGIRPHNLLYLIKLQDSKNWLIFLCIQVHC